MSPIISKTFSEVSLGIQKKRLSSEFTVLTVMILYLAIASDFPPSLPSPQVSGAEAAAPAPTGVSSQH